MALCRSRLARMRADSKDSVICKKCSNFRAKMSDIAAEASLIRRQALDVIHTHMALFRSHNGQGKNTITLPWLVARARHAGAHVGRFVSRHLAERMLDMLQLEHGAVDSAEIQSIVALASQARAGGFFLESVFAETLLAIGDDAGDDSYNTHHQHISVTALRILDHSGTISFQLFWTTVAGLKSAKVRERCLQQCLALKASSSTDTEEADSAFVLSNLLAMRIGQGQAVVISSDDQQAAEACIQRLVESALHHHIDETLRHTARLCTAILDQSSLFLDASKWCLIMLFETLLSSTLVPKSEPICDVVDVEALYGANLPAIRSAIQLVGAAAFFDLLKRQTAQLMLVWSSAACLVHILLTQSRDSAEMLTAYLDSVTREAFECNNPLLLRLSLVLARQSARSAPGTAPSYEHWFFLHFVEEVSRMIKHSKCFRIIAHARRQRALSRHGHMHCFF